MRNHHFVAGAMALTLLTAGSVVMASDGNFPASSPKDLSVESGSVYCFQTEDFQKDPALELSGVCITGVPEEAVGQVRLMSRVIVPGDFLTANQLNSLTFHPAASQEDQAQVTYLPIYGNQVESQAQLTISIHKSENQPPVAKDSSFETYKNLERTGTLDAMDPEGDALIYTLVEQPKRGQVVLHGDGTFTYTPKNNKVGKDQFTYTVTDSQGLTSEVAQVKLQILKPLDADAYRDVTTGQFEAMWMREQGLYQGELVAGQPVFNPDATVSRGDFLAMAMDLLEVPLEEDLSTSGFADEQQAPAWLKPYLATAMRYGLVTGSQLEGKTVFRPADPITDLEAAVLLDNILQLPQGQAMETVAPAWAREAVEAMATAGIPVNTTGQALTRAEVASMLYAVSKYQPGTP